MNGNMTWKNYKRIKQPCVRKGCNQETGQRLTILAGTTSFTAPVCHTCRRDYIVGLNAEGPLAFVFMNTRQLNEVINTDRMQLSLFGRK